MRYPGWPVTGERRDGNCHPPAKRRFAADGNALAPLSGDRPPGYRISCAAGAKAGLLCDSSKAWAPSPPPRPTPASRASKTGGPLGEDIHDTNLVQETQQMQAVSFTKGCCLGQEIVERVRARG